MSPETQYIDLFNSQRTIIDQHSTNVMNVVREKAYEDFCRIGFPSTKIERYKYTDIAALFAPDYGLNLQRLNIPVDPHQAFRCDVPNLTTSPYFIINDAFHTSKNDEKSEIIVDSLRNIAAKTPELINKFYATIAKTNKDGLIALNTMYAQDGLLVFIPKGIKHEKTIQVINIMRGNVDLMINRRVLIIMEEDSKATLLFCDHAIDNKKFLTNQVVEIFIGERASLDIYSMEETHYDNILVSNMHVKQERDSHFSHHSITLHNGITRNKIDVSLQGEGAECVMNGCVIADSKQHVDNNTLIIHQAPHCQSNELFKYVLDEKAIGAFAGRVLVKKGADKTSSEMRNQNLLATDTARMFTQPELEIYADDVKCAHGSTVGQINDAALFYMRQRGISLSEAQLLLQIAFIGEVIDNIKLSSLRDRLRYLVEKRFRGELNKCAGCSMCK